jgi:hypothetical protein
MAGKRWLLLVVIFLAFPSTRSVAQLSKVSSEASDACNYWISRIDPSVTRPIGMTHTIDEQATLRGMKCLLGLEGNKSKSNIDGPTRPNVSQTFDAAPVEVAALYYISYLYYEKWDHAQFPKLISKDVLSNEEIVSKAYSAYRGWFKEVNRVGLRHARRRHLDPLSGTKIVWY